jgi:hypothetical protein
VADVEGRRADGGEKCEDVAAEGVQWLLRECFCLGVVEDGDQGVSELKYWGASKLCCSYRIRYFFESLGCNLCSPQTASCTLIVG